MTVALIGLIGVVAGALLGGVISYRYDRKKQRTLARLGGRLLAKELTVARERMLSAADSSKWWEGKLPTIAWQGRLGDLALGLDLSNNQLQGIYDAYVDVDLWNARQGSEEFGEGTAPQLRKSAGLLLPVETWLAGELVAPVLTRTQRIVSALIAAVLLLGAATFEVLVPRPDLDSQTVAAALQSQLGDQVFVDCNPSGDEWSCTEHYLSPSRAACGIITTAAPAAAASPAALRIVAAISASNPAPCPKWIVASDGKRLDATPAEAEQARVEGRLKRFDEPTKNLLGRLLKLFGP
jgi:hypothetical protein